MGRNQDVVTLRFIGDDDTSTNWKSALMGRQGIDHQGPVYYPLVGAGTLLVWDDRMVDFLIEV